MTGIQKISPFLWFDDDAEEAAKFYTSVFKNSKVTDIARYGEAGSKASGRQKGSVMTVSFELEGQKFTALNGGPVFKFSPAISFAVTCETQDEVDYFWDKLSDGGQQVECGWLTDKYGVSWQIVPKALIEMLSDRDAKKSERVMEAMLQMKKLEIQVLRNAYGGQ
ncbi:MAG TPA: VOC family protein [Nitrososphaera sp.]|nr:VOC family protein [Nitrososphaera sp.]